jgi:RNA-binding protein YlmH
MTEKKFSFLNNITDDDRLLLCHVVEMARNAQEKYVNRFTFFLDERQQELCKQVLASEKLDNYTLWGGYESAERKIIGFFSPNEEYDYDLFPVKSVCFTYRKTDKLSHRDFLGVLMSLQIERYCVGDIIVGEGCTNVLVTDKISDRIIYEISKIGRVGVKAQYGFDKSVVSSVQLSEIDGTVASLRADCIVSFALHISREKASALIRQHGISVNHMINYKADMLLKGSDIFSVKGCGKFILKSINGVSKKERIRITLCKFI